MRKAYVFYAAIAAVYLLACLCGPEVTAGVSLAAVAGVVTGSRASAGTEAIESNSRVIDMSDTIHLLDPNMAPLTAVTMKLRKARAISPKVEWLEDDYLPSSDTVNGTFTTLTHATLTMDNIAYFRAGDVVKSLDSGECMLVTAISGDDIIVTRSVGGTAAAAIDDGETLLIIGNANAEGTTKRTLKTTEKTPQYNYTQIFRWPFGSTGTLQASELYGGDDMTYQTKKSGLEHRIQMERSFLFGERALNEAGAAAVRYCGGVLERVSTNVTSATTMNSDVLETFFATGFRYGPARKLFFCSRAIISGLNQIASASIETIPGDKSFPLALVEYVSGHGKVYLVTHNLLEGTGANNYAYEGYAMMLDLDSIFYRYLQGRDTRLKTNIQANDEDARIDEYLTECCPQVIQEENHSVLRNVQGVA